MYYNLYRCSKQKSYDLDSLIDIDSQVLLDKTIIIFLLVVLNILSVCNRYMFISRRNRDKPYDGRPAGTTDGVEAFHFNDAKDDSTVYCTVCDLCERSCLR